MNSKERQEMLDPYKHISAGLMERKGDRLMLSKKLHAQTQFIGNDCGLNVA